MDTKKFEAELAKDIESVGYHLYSLSYKAKDKILQVFIDESLDLNAMGELSEKVSAFMDKYDADFDEYLLDVSSIGAERPIRNEEELKDSIGKYIHVKTKEMEMDGTLLSFENGILTIEFLDKTRKKKTSVNYKDVKKLRLAVKF